MRPAIPMVLAIIIFTVLFLSMFGYIPKFHLAGQGAAEIHPPAVIGKPVSYNFTSLISQLPPGSSPPYTFYLGSGASYPPSGLTLGTDGRLRGAPAGPAGNFDVCVADAGGRSVCRTYHLMVNGAAEPMVTPTAGPAGTCPVTSCDTGTCCGSVHNGVKVSGVLTFGNCKCPVDTKFEQQDVITAGGPYNICSCRNTT